jgi:hypothetical protein
VFTVPVPVRYQLAFDAALTRAVLRVFLRTVFGWLRRRAARRGRVGARGGSVTAIQRFGGALNANVHFHALIFDGVYTRATPQARPVFYPLPPPTDADIAALLTRRHRRVRRLLARRGRLPEEAEGSDPFATEAPLFAQTVAASLQGRVALGPRAGQPLRRLRSAAAATVSAPRCARLDGFSLHADVAVPARRRDRLEHLVRYVLRPPLALDRLTESPGGQLLYHFRRPWSDGSTALLLDPLELLERLAALVPAPRGAALARRARSRRRAAAGGRGPRRLIRRFAHRPTPAPAIPSVCCPAGRVPGLTPPPSRGPCRADRRGATVWVRGSWGERGDGGPGTGNEKRALDRLRSGRTRAPRTRRLAGARDCRHRAAFRRRPSPPKTHSGACLHPLWSASALRAVSSVRTFSVNCADMSTRRAWPLFDVVRRPAMRFRGEGAAVMRR